MTEIGVPNSNWWPRAHQMPLWEFLQAGGKRAIAVWHRRAGKDEICLHHAAVSMLRRPGNYWHCNPEYAQSRKSVWTAINPHSGKRRIDEAFPIELRENTNDQEMFIRFRAEFGGSTWQCIGSDSYDRTVGSSAAGITYSEYALCNPSAWAYHRPMLEENDGWAAFITTPRGRNHAHALYLHASRSPGWFCQLLTAEDTGALSHEALAEALAEYKALYGDDIGAGQFEQEYMCSFDSNITLGAFYAREMREVRQDGRIVECEPIEGRPVNCAWDLGIGDDTCVFWFQPYGGQLLILDCHAASGMGVEQWRDEIFRRERERGWIHGSDYVPHDAKIREWGTGRSRVETMAQLGLKPVLVPLATIDDGINAVRRSLPLCVFHPRCEATGIVALEQYHREWDDERKCFKPTALHDWSSHPADAFRYLAMSWRPAPLRLVKPPKPEGWHIPPPAEPRRGGIML